jgi:hypothetical protein
MRRRTNWLCLLPILMVVAACHSKPTDETIAKDIQAKVSSDPATRDSQIAVKAKNGEVILLGTTKSQAARQRIEKIAKEEAGVSEVENHTTVVGQEAASGAASARPTAPAPEPPPPVVVPVGTVLTIRTNQALSTKTTTLGSVFTGSMMTPITIEGVLAIPAGSEVVGTVREVKKAGRFKGGALLSLSLNSVNVHGHTYNIVTDLLGHQSKGKGKRTAGMVGGGAAAGATIGAVAGGGAGAAIGAVAGAAVGTVGAMTGKRDIVLPVESALSFELDQPLTLKPNSAT